jgi:hypothetical protein
MGAQSRPREPRNFNQGHKYCLVFVYMRRT